MRLAVLLLAACGSRPSGGAVPSDPSDPPTAPSPPEPVPTVTSATVEALPRVFVNELCADNHAGPADEEGGHPDWIELYNPNAEAFPLAGVTITDDADEPGKHAFDASLAIPAGGVLLLWADGAPDEGPLHLGFELDADGDRVALYRDGVRLSDVQFGPLLEDAALARTEDGGADFVVTLAPTPGASNGAAAAEPGPAHAEPDETCVPTASVAEPYLLEGATVAMTVGCASGADPVAIGVTTLSARPEPAFVPPDLTWTTDLDDGGRLDVLFVVEDAGHVGVPETVRGTAWVADAWRDPANVPVDPATYREELGLPVLHLDPHAPISQSYVDMDATYDGVAYTGTVKIRGASSSGYPKKSLTLELEPEQLDLDDVGLGHKDHLVLASNFDDSAYVRQKLVFDTWADLAALSGDARLAPRTAFVVVYLDGAYYGLFTAIDHVDDELVEEMGFDGTGDVYKSVDHDANFYLTDSSGRSKSTLHQGYEKKEGTPGDFSDLDALVDFVARADHAEFDAEADAWIDRDEFMDWFALVHWTAADDSGGKNAYLYDDPATGLFRFAPWDFNQSFGQNWYTARESSSSFNDFVWTNAVFWHFQDDPAMDAVLEQRFADQRAAGGPFDPAVLLAKTDAYYAEIEPSCLRDWDRWGGAYWSYFGWARSDRNDFVAERAYLEQWIADRAAYMDSVHP